MDTLKDIIKYLFVNYPYKNELSKARVVKMVYLADWKYAITYGRQITDIQWYFNHYGPYVSDVINEIREDEDFTLTMVSNVLGEPKELIMVKENFVNPEISPNVKDVLDFVIKKTAPLFWEDFIDLVYSTYPVVTQPRYSYLDLVELAKEYTKKI